MMDWMGKYLNIVEYESHGTLLLLAIDIKVVNDKLDVRYFPI